MQVPGSVDCIWAQLWVMDAVVMALAPCDSHVGHDCISLIVMHEKAFALMWVISKSFSARVS